MQLPDLRKTIVNKEKQPLYVFIGEEVAVMDTYIKQIAKTFGADIMRVDSVLEIYNKIQNKSIINKKTCYVITNDLAFLKAEKMWPSLMAGKIQGQNVIILTYPSLDKRGKFFKQFSGDDKPIVEFEKLGSEILTKYITREVALNSHNCQTLIDICESNYNRILLELDKVKQIMHAKQITPDSAFSIALDSKLFFIPTGDIIFQFTDAVCLKNKSKSFSLWEKLKSSESPIKVLSLLYNNFRSILLVELGQGASKICDFIGLTPWQVKLAKEKRGHFSADDLLRIIKLIRTTEVGIKRGLIEQEMSVDYLLVNILGA